MPDLMKGVGLPLLESSSTIMSSCGAASRSCRGLGCATLEAGCSSLAAGSSALAALGGSPSLANAHSTDFSDTELLDRWSERELSINLLQTY